MRADPLRAVGRRQELELAHDAVDAVTEGSGKAIVLRGGAGMGKTAMLHELMEISKGRRFQIRYSGGEELEAYKPFGVLLSALNLPGETGDPRCANVSRLLRKPCPEDFGPIDAQLRFRIIDELVELIADLALQQPLLLAVDDAHWADITSLSTLGRLSSKLPELPLLLVLSYRPDNLSHEQQHLLCDLEARGSLAVTLPALDREAQVELVGQVMGAEPDESVLEQLSITGGNPFFLTAVLSDMLREGSIQVREGRARMVKPLPAHSLDETLELQVDRLSSQCQRILKVASILGCSFSVADLSALFSESAASLLPFIAEAYGAGMLVESGPQLSFRHELIRDFLYNDIPSSVREALHSEAARRLSQKGASAVRVAAHYYLGASRGDREAVEWLGRAAGEIRARCPDTAIKLLEKALLLSEDSLQDRTEILAKMLNVLALAGDPARAESLGRELLSIVPARFFAMRVRRDLARALWRQGQPEEAAKMLRDVLGYQGIPDSMRARFLAEIAYLEVKYEAAPDLSTGLALEARALGKRAGDPVAVGMSLHVLGRKAWWRGRFARGAALQASAIEIGQEDGQEVQYFTPHQHLALCLVELDRFEESERVLETGLSMIHEIGERATYFHQYHAIYGYLYAVTGRWAEALSHLSRHVTIAKDRKGYREVFEAAMSIRVYLAMHTGDLALAEEVTHWPGQTIEKVVSALFEHAKGNRDAARAQLSTLDEGTLSSVPVFRRLVWPEGVKLAMELELPDVAALLVKETERIAHLNAVPSAEAALLRAKGLLLGDLELLEEAVAQYKGSQRLYEAASVMEEAATLAGRLGNQERARELFLPAIEIYDQIGAHRDVRRADASARGLGIHRGIRAKRQHATRGWDSLTRTERRVLTMIAEGMTNKRIADHLYISPRTVETHVMHILRKLGLKSRAEAAAALAKESNEHRP